MNEPTINIDQVLLDVRKAYRLLHNYQRLALDAVAYISKQLGLPYGGGWPKYSAASPRSGSGSLDCWAWDWLNMMYYDFHFDKQLDNGSTLMVSILLISDTGCFCGKSQEPEPSDFPLAELCSTKIGFLISAKGWPCDFLQDHAAMKTFVETGGQIPELAEAEGAIGKCFDFSRLMSEESTNLLIDELVALAATKGIPLKRIVSKE